MCLITHAGSGQGCARIKDWGVTTLMLHLNDFKSCQNIPPPDISKTKVLFIDAVKSKARLLKGSFRILEHSLGIKIVKLFEEVVYIM